MQLARLGYGKLLCCYPAAVRRGVGGFRVAKHLHLPVTHDKQAETAGRERDDALIGEWAERFRDGLNRHRVVLHSAAVNLTLPLTVTVRPTRHSVRLLFVYGGFHGWVTES